MILSNRQAAKVTAAIETIGSKQSPPPVPQRPSWAEHSVVSSYYLISHCYGNHVNTQNGVDSTKVIKPLHHVIQDDLDKERFVATDTPQHLHGYDDNKTSSLAGTMATSVEKKQRYGLRWLGSTVS